MSNPKNISIEEYNYPLPDERIAKFPLENRDDSKLLVYRNGSVSQSVFRNLADELPNNLLMVFNNTKVINKKRPITAIIHHFLTNFVRYNLHIATCRQKILS